MDPNSPITLRTRKFMTNRLMQRRQMVLDVIHPNRPNVSRAELQEKLGELYKTPKEQCFVFGMRTHYGGGRSTGFALIYDSEEALKLEATFRLVRNGLKPKVEKPSRKLRKERKNRAKKVRGTKKSKAGDAKKK
ncbi:ribosomal protein S24A [Malassezia yamatoensis]|uniref:Ribosomal protein S24A n=1 Tax=Malassezia yamatoensis TaxID=253288 RepID=A0AAJ6CI56_9BASI|nr:ribosomal protein S24A [Malassezia yamatoensis]